MLLGCTVFSPWGEPSQLPVVAIVCHKHLWSDQENLAILNNDPAVVLDILVHNRPRIHEQLSGIFRQPQSLRRTDLPQVTR